MRLTLEVGGLSGGGSEGERGWAFASWAGGGVFVERGRYEWRVCFDPPAMLKRKMRDRSIWRITLAHSLFRTRYRASWGANQGCWG
ncbi:MAG: hypothetical protein R6U98_29205 [Pirellulaceae bacterium]